MCTSTGSTVEVIAEFERDLALTRARAEALIITLVRAIENSGDSSDEFFWEQIDALKSDLSTRAANACGDDPHEQERAISHTENWVANNISNAAHEAWLAAVLTVHGVEDGERIVRDHLMQTSWQFNPTP